MTFKFYRRHHNLINKIAIESNGTKHGQRTSSRRQKANILRSTCSLSISYIITTKNRHKHALTINNAYNRRQVSLCLLHSKKDLGDPLHPSAAERSNIGVQSIFVQFKVVVEGLLRVVCLSVCHSVSPSTFWIQNVLNCATVQGTRMLFGFG